MKHPKDDMHSFSEVAIRRAKVYQLLAQIFLKPPTIVFLKKLKNSLHMINSASISIAGLDMVYTFLNELGDDSYDEIVHKLSVEFTRLFRGTSPHAPTPPYESAYTEGCLWGQSTVKVLKEYQQLGLSVSDNYKNEPPDHISFELSFMQFLCEEEAEAWNRNDKQGILSILEREEHFLSEHLLKWFFWFCECIRAHDKLGFYRGWVDFLEEWVKSDYHHVRETQLALRRSILSIRLNNVAMQTS